jgi:signal transduction histidine kinase
MIGITAVAVVAAIAAASFWMRARAEIRSRIAAEETIAKLEHARAEPDASHSDTIAAAHAEGAASPPENAAGSTGTTQDPATRRRRLLGVVAHELRSPISAIVGYQELLSEGIFGPLEPRALEATSRIRHSAQQLLHLIDGMYELAHDGDPVELELGEVHADELVDAALRLAEGEGAGRGVSISRSIPAALPVMLTDGERLRRTLDLILAAGIKSSPNAALTIAVHPGDDSVTFSLDGTAIDPVEDAPDPAAPESFRSGVALRLAMANVSARSIGGSIACSSGGDGTRLTLRVPLRITDP